MKSLKELLVCGPGPSSSHTIGPYRIVKHFLTLCPKEGLEKIEVTLYGSLALTGKGHSTDDIIKKALGNIPSEVFFVPSLKGLTHPNTMQLKAFYKNKDPFIKRYISVGGGAFSLEGEKVFGKDCYPFSTCDELKEYMKKTKTGDIYDVILRFDDPDIYEYGKKMLFCSFHTIEEALQKTGILPGPLKLERVAKSIYSAARAEEDAGEQRLLLLSAYAYATSEANAAGEMIVTAPTCGAAGVVPAVLYYSYHDKGMSEKDLVKAYLVGALFCQFIKENAGVSGALLGCQSEVGSASSFASASLSYLAHLPISAIEYSAEVGMEHFLGLTCDPVDGYVQIPCIERNAMAAIHAYSAYLFAKHISLYRKNRVSFDNVIKAMKETGAELSPDLKETSLGGLAKVCS